MSILNTPRRCYFLRRGNHLLAAHELIKLDTVLFLVNIKVKELRTDTDKEIGLVKIRLKRFGARKEPHYRVVVTDVRRARDGAYIESLGSYDPRGAQGFTIEESRLNYWLDHGAQMTPRVKALLRRLRREQQTTQVSAAAEEVSGQPEVEPAVVDEPEEKKVEDETGKKTEPLEVEETEQPKPDVADREGGSDEGTA